MADAEMMAGARRSTMDELADSTLAADKVLAFQMATAEPSVVSGIYFDCDASTLIDPAAARPTLRR